ncbi:MAG TPA: tRNA (adenosine(37)-N6)-threonylcarbamoyltransferase complex transferase subunit TsaD [Candidatus Peribacter riflensis]|uniref:tRNA N6-adenosine threonylcarbamoyltransferase n=1 Tax=Candidatus Peribacter riflensis TaxID=1735162 RepID=A0A0S1SF29_9BACT|nr:MAG: O-sialoglycoprotein endopeptidase [Candidatus Peribacter riflensis]OGJ77069.1 MAG: tRNA (adenosine(37)-N6)-threonylcarbamoyltransferase complex transferase subunit TsaD [Candidatus Peribacteria bacterium RIFOXYB1_FULL_57_12]OGJ79082.1 MAG: tRNA (adenosine(37)-N6)-threonylcarbamoyltransferase complex transferase subunit TsaD [Candidatus Peribacteria bacterium RIFOXYC1_FULL_58_8]ALM11018.1 MAG: O-sialoglycoprotein endopeptidase [Candidatus Peribacter riflensis]ALM12121.1 MAG: O-sialoglyco
MLLLAIETSCDETSAAVAADGTRVLSCVIASSSTTFARSGGVIPEHAAREQIRAIQPVIDQALEDAKCTPAALDGLAVTRGPGLLGSLLVGSVTARALASLWKKPLIGVHHTLGHLSSTWLDCETPPHFPVLTLSASGGHTELWLRESHTRGTLLGSTRDDAAGEAFDKGASLLGLPYPGGPAISRAAETGNPLAFPFPHPLKSEETLDFSYSGLKTALKYLIRDLQAQGVTVEQRLPDLAASFELAICTHLCDRIERALKQHPEVHELHVAGGVSANRRLRTLVAKASGNRTVRFPTTLLYCTDNAAMIAAAATFLLQERGDGASRAFETAASLPSETVFGA